MPSLDQHMKKAVNLHQQGQHREAKRLYQEALKAHPKHPAIHNLLGALLAEQERYQDAIQHFKKAVHYAADPRPYFFNLGEAFCRNGQFAEGIAQFKKLEATPQQSQAYYAIAKGYEQLQTFDHACAYYQRVIEDPTFDLHADLYLHYGHCLQQLRRYRSAIALYEEGIRQAPPSAALHFALAELLFADKQFERAQTHYLKTVEMNPEHTLAHFNLWRLNTACDAPERAKPHLTAFLKQSPDTAHLAHWMHALDLPMIPQSQSEKRQVVQQLEEKLAHQDFAFTHFSDFSQWDIFPPYILAYYGFDDRQLREDFAQRILQTDLFPTLTPAGKSRSHARVGCVVTPGHEGVFIKCMGGMIRALQSHFDLSIVCMQPNGKSILVQALPDCQYLELPNDLWAAAQTLQKKDFDLLYYWEIGTGAHNYFLPFFRTARKQVASWGWPVTSGLPYIDAYFSNQYLEPSTGQNHYTEPLFQGSRLLTYYTPPTLPAMAPPRHMPPKDTANVYLCTQNLRKVQPEMDSLLAGILNADPRAKIFFIADKLPTLHQRLQARWSRQNMDLERLHILPRMNEQEYLNWVRHASVILDTPCYTGGANTNYDAFQMGTPVVTREGHLHRARYTAAAYRQMGYTACIAQDDTEYIQQALRIAQDNAYRHEVSSQIQAKRHVLFNDQEAVRACADLIQQVLDSP